MRRISIFLAVIYLGFILSGCNPQPTQITTPTQITRIQQLRIINNSIFSIENLIVQFPEDKIVFGDIPAGTTTEYKEVPNGVFRYSAYEFELGGEPIGQPVIDWVGEVPMEGILFTYTIGFDPKRMDVREWWIELLNVEIDE